MGWARRAWALVADPEGQGIISEALNNATVQTKAEEEIAPVDDGILKTDTGDAAEEDHFDDAQIAMAVVIVVFLAVAAEPLLIRYRLTFIPTSVVWVAIGACSMALLAQYGQDKSSVLNPEIFFFLMIPPIIFNAGYTTEHSFFFGNFRAISGMAFLGTLISAGVIGAFLYAFCSWGYIPLDLKASTAFMFGALLSSTDPVGLLSVLNGKSFKNMDKNIKTVIVGESMLNDAVAITLYKTFASADFIAGAPGVAHHNQLSRGFILAVARFVYCTMLSLIMGVTFGLSTSAVSCKIKMLRKHPKIELLVTFFAAYLCYCVSEICQASASKELSELTSSIAEVVIYLYLGMTFTRSLYKDEILFYNTRMIIATLVLLYVSRAVAVSFVALLVNASGEAEDHLNWRSLVLLWFSAVRGAIPFALAVQIPGHNRGILVTTTLAIVVFTTIFNGGLTPPLARLLGLLQDKNRLSTSKSKAVLNEEAHALWVDIDTVLSRYFGGERAVHAHEVSDLGKQPPVAHSVYIRGNNKNADIAYEEEEPVFVK